MMGGQRENVEETNKVAELYLVVAVSYCHLVATIESCVKTFCFVVNSKHIIALINVIHSLTH